MLIFFNLPATVAHELAHWLVAQVTRSRPGFPSLWPRRNEKGWVLGSVTFSASFWSAGLVALAPLLVLGPLSVWGLWLRAKGQPADEFLAGVGFAYTLWGSIPSSSDWALAAKYPLGPILMTLALAVMARAIGGG